MVMRRHVLLTAVAGLVLLAAGAQQPTAQSGPSRPLDERLLEGLGADPLDEVDHELFEPDSKASRQEQTPGSNGEAAELDRRLLEELGRADDPAGKDPLLAIARQMRQVEQHIVKGDSGEKTQARQQQILAALDRLIQQARKSCCGSKPSASKCQGAAPRRPLVQPKKKPGAGKRTASQKPVADPNAKPGQARAGRPDMGQLRETLKQLWGELPERQREQMLELPVEEFLPEYELMIEQYFKRLTEEKE